MMVLLPSALPCENGGMLAYPKPQRPIRPSLPSFDHYEPHHRSQSPVLGLIASCRALQSMIGEYVLPSTNLSSQTTHHDHASPNPFDQFFSPTTRPLPTPQRPNKRSRDELESQDIMAHDRLLSPRKRQHTAYSTPKRRCAAPLELPPGLQASDFEALGDDANAAAVTAKPRKRNTHVEMPSQEQYNDTPASPQKDMIWTPDDDRRLVETVLFKLNLSSQDWNECAKSLGKDKDSLGRRWQLLIGNGNVGLRRGIGRPERMDLDIQSW